MQLFIHPLILPYFRKTSNDLSWWKSVPLRICWQIFWLQADLSPDPGLTQMKVNSQARQEVSFVANSATTETTESNSSGPDSPRTAPHCPGQAGSGGESHVSAGLRGVHWQFIWEEISDEFKRPRPCLPDGPPCVSWEEENLPT